MRFVLIIIFLLTLTACGAEVDEGNDNSNEQVEQDEEGREGSSDEVGSEEDSEGETEVDNDAFVHIVTYNIEWLGDPGTAGLDLTEAEQIEAAAEDILDGYGDIYALQEIGGIDAMNDLVDELNEQDAINNWSGGVSQAYASQSLAFVYKTNLVSNVRFETILTSEDDYQFATRYPYMMSGDIVIDEYSVAVSLINLHLKCCSGSSESSRRAQAMATIESYIVDNHADINMMILGDLNVANEGGAYGEISDWGIYDDNDNDGINDFSHAAGSLINTVYDSRNTESDIDHILISNELLAAWENTDESERNQYLNTSISDHSPVKTSLNLAYIMTDTVDPADPESEEPSKEEPGEAEPGDTYTPEAGINVDAALNTAEGADVVVTGRIKSAHNGIYALVMEDMNDSDTTIYVKLEGNQRDQWSPENNSGLIGDVIRVTGIRDTYTNGPSIESVTNIQSIE
jgi:endonuclease/exonuclease/phosphatase family metal-dependent hydrolase